MMRRSRREIIQWLAMLGAVAGFSRCEAESVQAPSYDDEEAYRVYSTLIPRDWIWEIGKAESLVIAALTVSSEICVQPDSESAVLLDPAIANYKDLTTRRWRLKREFTLSKPYTLVDQQELEGGWDRFYARYPKSGGYLFLSPVGFNAAKDIAIVQVNHSCGGLCGGGTLSVLQKRDGEWKPMKWSGSSCAWAS